MPKHIFSYYVGYVLVHLHSIVTLCNFLTSPECIGTNSQYVETHPFLTDEINSFKVWFERNKLNTYFAMSVHL